MRGLQSAGTQTQYCQLWAANLCTPVGSCGSGGCETGEGSGEGSVLCAAQSSSSSGSEDGSAAGCAGPSLPASGAVAPPAAAVGVLPLPVLQQQIRELYRAKASADIAVARRQRPFQPLADFMAAYLAQQHGVQGLAVQQRARQLQASVEAHAAADREVALFGLAAGMLEEAPGADSPGAATLVVAPDAAGGATAESTCPSSAAAAVVPLVLYASRRHAGTAAAQHMQDARPALRRFSASAWHATAAASADRPALAGPERAFNPAGPDQLLPPMVAGVHNLALGVPGVEQLATWVLGGGLGAVLPRMDLGLRLSENQVGLVEGLVVGCVAGCVVGCVVGR